MDDRRLITVLGRPRSGTRLLTRILKEAERAGRPIRVNHAGHHGKKPEEISDDVVLALRDEFCQHQSRETTFGQDWPTLEQLRADYGDRVRIEIDYEDVVRNVDGVIARLACAFRIEPWVFTEEIIDGNAKWLAGQDPAELRLQRGTGRGAAVRLDGGGVRVVIGG